MENNCNIDTKGQQRRRMIGVFSLVLGGMLAGFAVGFHFSFLERLIVFPFFAAGFVSLLESQQRVCVVHAYLNKIEEDGKIQSAHRNPHIVAAAKKIILYSMIAALICTLAVIVIGA